MRVSWLIPFTAGMFVVPTLYGVIGDDARNHIEGLALRLRTQFQANLQPRDNFSAPVVKDSAPRPDLQGPKPPVEGRAPDDPTPKADAQVSSPSGRGTPAIQGDKVAPVPGPAPGAERPERNSRDPDALAQDPEKGTAGDRGPSPTVARPPDVSLSPSGEVQLPIAQPKAQPEDHAVLSPPRESRVPEPPGVKVEPKGSLADPSGERKEPSIERQKAAQPEKDDSGVKADTGNPSPPSPSNLAKGRPNADLGDRRAGAVPPNAPRTEALKANPGPPMPQSPSDVARRLPGERQTSVRERPKAVLGDQQAEDPEKRSSPSDQSSNTDPGTSGAKNPPPVAQPNQGGQRDPGSVGVRAGHEKPATQDQSGDRKAPTKPTAKLSDSELLLSNPATGSLGLKAGNPVAPSQAGAYRTRSNRSIKKKFQNRFRELSAYQYPKRYKRHDGGYYYDHHFYNDPSANYQKSRDWTGRSGCDAVYMPYGYNWVLTRDPLCK